MKKTQDMLLSTQDKKQLALYFARNKDQLPTKIETKDDWRKSYSWME